MRSPYLKEIHITFLNLKTLPDYSKIDFIEIALYYTALLLDVHIP